MIADLKPYAEYEASGLPWLGQVPRHWVVSPLARLARLKSVINQSDRQLLSVYLQRGVVRFCDVAEKRTNTTSEDLSKYQAVDPGDFVLNNQQAWRGSVGVSDFSGIVSPAYLVLALSSQYLPRYANLLFRDQSMVDQYLICSKGVGTIQRNLNWPHLKRVGVLIPPPAEQAAIVSFLDWANGRLERTIRAKRKVIALLNEQKQAIIHRAVTRGLDPSEPLKPSGIPWLGEIPAHWEVLPVKRCATMISKGTTPSTEGREFLESGPIRFIKAESVSAGRITDEPKVFIDHETHALLARSQLRENDILFVIAGATLGKVAVVRLEHLPANTNQAVAFVRPNHRVLPEFLAVWLQSGRIKEQVWLSAVQSAQPNLSMNSLGKFPMPLPPLDEQLDVVRRIAAELSRPNTAISRLEGEIALLREYRTRLVADVVTGKLDVREVATRLPNEELLPDLAAADDEPEDLPIEEEADA